jgi:hypothetical protein
MEFKVGDKVKVSKKIYEYEFLFKKNATVVGVYNDYEYPIELKFDNDDNDVRLNDSILFKEDELEFIENGTTLKNNFIKKCEEVGVPKIIAVAVKRPSGAIETIVNTEETLEKVEYYKNTYDENFCLINNKGIKIVGFMVV